MKAVHERPSDIEDQPVVWMASPGYEDMFVIVLVPGRKQAKVHEKDDFEHLGVSVESKDEIRKMVDKARQAGILQWDYEEMGTPVGTICGIRDPDGNYIEFSFGQELGRNNPKKEAPKPPGLG